MNTIPPTNLMQIRTQGLELLTRELGPVVMIRFLQQFELGRGDYSTERHQWLDGQTVADLLAQLRTRQSSQVGGATPFGCPPSPKT